MNASLPDSWPLVKLGACLRRRKDTVMPSTLDDPTVGLVGLEDIQDGGRGGITVRPTKPSEIDSLKTRFQVGDILYGKLRPYLNKVGIAQSDGLCSTEIWAFTTEPFLDPRFAAHYLASSFFVDRVESLTKGANLPRLDSGSFDSISIPLPPLSEQQRIVDILQEAEEIRRLRAQAEAKTAELIPAIFHNRFVRDQAHEYQPLHKLAEVVSGVAIGRKSRGMAIEVPYVRVANVQAGYIDLSEIKDTPATESEIEQYALKNGDVLLTEGGDFDKLGRGALWEGQVSPCIHQNHVFRVRPNREKLLPRFFAHYLQSAKAKSYFLRCAKKTTNLASINLTQLMALPVPVVPLKEQEAFEAEIESASKAVTKEGEHLFAALSRSLSAHAFTGQLTEEWREKYQRKLTSEGRDRDAALQKVGVAHPLPRRITIQEMDRIYDDNTDGIYSDLNREQRALLGVIQRRGEEPTPYLTAAELSTRVDGTLQKNPQAIESHLAVFAARGILIPVSREEHPPDTTLYVFGNAYRLPMEDRNDSLTSEEGVAFTTEEGQPLVSETILGERRRVHELGRLVGRLERENRMS